MRFALASTLLLAAALPATALADTIKLAKGRPPLENVEVIEETMTGVSYKIHGSLQEEPAENVIEVVYDRKPIGFDEALGNFRRGSYAVCQKDFEQLQNAREAWVKMYAGFHVAECRRHLGDLAGAAAGYEKFMKDFPNARFYPAAKLGLGLVKLEQKDFTGAQKVFEELASEARAKKLGDWANRANIQLAATLEAQGKQKEALERYQRLVASSKGGDGVAQVAVYRLQAQLDPSKADSSLSGLNGLVEGQNSLRPDVPVDFELLAAAHTAMGDIYDVKGEHEKALLAYLRVVVDPDLAKVTSERPHALWGAARAFEKVKGEDWRARAESLKRELRDSFPNSVWAKKS